MLFIKSSIMSRSSCRQFQCARSTILVFLQFISWCKSTEYSSKPSFAYLISPTSVPLTFLDTFQDTITDPGPSVSLRCIASGNPLPQVTWLLDGQTIPDSVRFRTGDYVTRDGLLVSYVNISSIGPQDGGLYVSSESQMYISLFLATIHHSIFWNELFPSATFIIVLSVKTRESMEWVNQTIFSLQMERAWKGKVMNSMEGREE